MKKIILFFTTLFCINGYSQGIITHSDYTKSTGIACVFLNNNLYTVKWFPNKKWLINETEYCTMGGPKNEFQESEKDSLEFHKEIIFQITNPKPKRKIPYPPR